jgi:AcrR family transcriptional regulator
MTDVIDQTETDVRERILVTAERLFREIGYRKNTLADIDLRMSSANVYRFFDSKKPINASVASRLMREVEHASRVTTVRPWGATGRLHELLETVHRMKLDGYAGDSKMHEIVAAAMQENWECLQGAHRLHHRYSCGCDRRRRRVQ